MCTLRFCKSTYFSARSASASPSVSRKRDYEIKCIGPVIESHLYVVPWSKGLRTKGSDEQAPDHPMDAYRPNKGLGSHSSPSHHDLPPKYEPGMTAFRVDHIDVKRSVPGAITAMKFPTLSRHVRIVRSARAHSFFFRRLFRTIPVNISLKSSERSRMGEGVMIAQSAGCRLSTLLSRALACMLTKTYESWHRARYTVWKRPIPLDESIIGNKISSCMIALCA